ncbi:sulfite exporter TauE/SafE family protein [Paraeggerthella hongkongensis]|uniref:sulfite exporter TauE/SafE family protein n=1 Tax=Paraeggerthella hominis TaxID=2897351 RepID=UPI001C11C743|nr:MULTISPECIES: sulfite exporter TauE/SafE family protein [Paraeggerthella]MBU5405391.1 sulfite exporter TauE/SafE family protein [Paraeggerthella hongkongensis]MCD2432487.1 sulfite exporter TauE/SafE family protein [Paraeggerthella hominis]
MDIFMLYVLPALVGVGIGILSGLLGIGGGTVMVPIFRLAFDMSPVMSTATSLFTIIPTSVSGAVSHIRHKTCIPSLGIAAGLGGAITSPLGVWLAQISPAWMIMLAAALIIGWSAFKMLSKAFKMKKASPVAAESLQAAAIRVETAPDKSVDFATTTTTTTATASGGPAGPSPSSKLTRKQLLVGAAIGLVAGVASGYVGVGGGFIMVPMMLSLVGISMRQASGTSLIAVMILAVPGVIEQALLGNINYAAGIAIAIGSIPGAVVGARLVRVVPERMLRFIFGCFLLLAAALLVLNEFGILS